MPLILADRVRDTTTTTGTGTVTLSGTAPTGYQNFSVIGNGNTTYYTINAGSQWEVGIGTYSSTGPTLSRNTVLESSNANALVDFAAGTKDVFVTYPADKSVNYDENNNVGIGTTSPSAILETSSSSDGSIFASTYVGSGVGGSFIGRKARGSQSSPSGILSGDTLTSVLGRGYTSAGAFSGNVGAVAIVAAENFSSTANGTNITFATTTTGATSRTERMRIDSAGNVGIGTSSPTFTLQVNGTGYFNSNVAFFPQDGFRFTSASAVSAMRFGSAFTGESTAEWAYNRAGAVATLSIGATGSALTEIMRAQSNGNVGIGVSAPGTRLQVADVAAPSGFSSTAVRVTRSNYGADFIGYIDQGVGHGGIISTVDNGTPTERMRITNAGNVGIGTTTTGVNDRLRVEGAEARIRSRNSTSGAEMYMGAMNPNEARLWASTSTALTFGTSDAERMRITDGGRVGIGTSAPSARLDVNTGAGTDCIVASRGGNAAYFVLQGTSFFTFNAVQSYDGSGNLQWAVGSQGAANTLSFMVNGNTERARIDSSGNFSLGTTVGLARLRVAAGGTVTVPVLGNVTNYPAFISNPDPSYGLGIGVNPGDGRVWLQAQRSDTAVAYNITLNEAGGRVGVGTSSPQQIFQVTTSGQSIDGPFFTSSTGPWMRFIPNSSPGAYNGIVAAGTNAFIFSNGSPNAGTLTIAPWADGTSGVVINASGNVGIGTNSPQQTASGRTVLGVNGTSSSLINIGSGGNFGSYWFWDGSTTTLAANNTLSLLAGNSPILFNNNNTERMRIDSSGRVGIGTSGPSSPFQVNALSGSSQVAYFVNDSTGSALGGIASSINAGGNNTSSYHFLGVTQTVAIWYLYGNGTTSYTSDIRVKKNVETTRDGYLDDVCKLRVVKYNWYNDSDDTPRELGFIAQEVEQVFPGLVQDAMHPTKDGVCHKVLKGSVMMPIMLKALQEANEKIDALAARVAQLEGN